MQTSSVIKKMSLSLLLMITIGLACKKEKSLVTTESLKDIAGTWKIASVTRNEVDITNYFDFSKFRIIFKSDGSYTIENAVPFVVSKNGKWSMDDSKYPIYISFTQDGATTPVENEFVYPISKGIRNIVLTGSPGCIKNSYQYTLINAGQ